MHTAEPDIGRIYRTHFKSIVYQIARYVTREDAEDIVSEVFVRCLESSKKFKSDYHAKMFVFISSKNRCIDIARRKPFIYRRHFKYLYLFSEESKMQKTQAQQDLQERERVRIIKKISLRLEKLPAMQRFVLEQRLLGKTNWQMAQETNRAIQTIKNQVFKMRLNVRESIRSFDQETLDILYDL